jgi:hypothetical protein
MARYNIDTCALLVELNVSQWTARKLDRSTTDELVATSMHRLRVRLGLTRTCLQGVASWK